QHELRLDLDVESPRGLEQAQQDLAEGDLLQRLVEDRLADRTDRGLEFADARIRRNPARLEVYLRHATVIAPEEGQEILRKVVLVDLVKRAHDAEVQRDVSPVRGNQDVSGMHVGMEESVAEHLREENLDAGARELRNVYALLSQFRDLADRRADH